MTGEVHDQQNDSDLKKSEMSRLGMRDRFGLEMGTWSNQGQARKVELFENCGVWDDMASLGDGYDGGDGR